MQKEEKEKMTKIFKESAMSDYDLSIRSLVDEYNDYKNRNGNHYRHKLSCADYILDLKKKGIKCIALQSDVNDYLESLKPQSEDDESNIDVDYIDNVQTELWNFIEWVYQFDDIDEVDEVL